MEYTRQEAKKWAKNTIKGFYECPFTPISKSLEIDEVALRENIDKFAELKVDGLVVGGFVSDCWNMTLSNWFRYHEIIADANRGRIPIWTIILDSSLHQALEKMAFVEKLGYVGAEVMNPSVQLRADNEIYDYFKYMTDYSNLAIVLYRTPVSGTVMSVDLVRRLAELDTVVGVKQGSVNRVESYILRSVCHPDFIVSDPVERFFLDDLRHGGQVIWAAFWYLALGKKRHLLREYYELALQGRWEEAYKPYNELEPIRGFFDQMAMHIFRTGSYTSHQSIMKPWMDAVGFKAGYCLPPTKDTIGKEKEELLNNLSRLGIA